MSLPYNNLWFMSRTAEQCYQKKKSPFHSNPYLVLNHFVYQIPIFTSIIQSLTISFIDPHHKWTTLVWGFPRNQLLKIRLLTKSDKSSTQKNLHMASRLHLCDEICRFNMSMSKKLVSNTNFLGTIWLIN